MMAAAQQNMAKDENAFADEAELGKQTYLWSDKYRPRKPRYFNRVHTGFDWNKVSFFYFAFIHHVRFLVQSNTL